jgi:broad specificity phosphatase PhoE
MSLSLRGILLATVLCLSASGALADTGLWQKLYEPGHFAIMRHATAPGTGDPDNFRIGDCSTQRNLNDTGRAEAKAVGQSAKDAGIKSARVYSSQWCRCMETARNLGLGAVQELPALNSFYQRAEDRDPNLAALKTFIEANADKPGPVILVTHQVTISALTRRYTRQGEVIVFRHAGNGEVDVVGSIPPG